MSDPVFSDEIQLTIRDRINYPYVLANQIITIQRVLLNEEAAKEVIDSVEALVHQIPDLYKDEAFHKEIDAAVLQIKKDIRPKFGGKSIDDKTCEELGIPITEEVEEKDPWAILQAVFNLLQRRSMLTRRSFVEKIVLKPDQTDIEYKDENQDPD